MLAEALARHVSADAGTLMTAGPFGLSDRDALRAVVAEAGFSDITVHPAMKILRFPSSDEFVLRYTAGSALVNFVAGANDDARSAIMAAVTAKLQSYVDDHGLAFPIETNVLVARK